MSNERDIILESLIEILEKGQLSHIVERNVLDKYDYLPNNEKAFIKRVIEGTIENLLPIDDVINTYSKVKTNKLKPMIRTILRMSVYQIIYMDKVPDSAVCNEAVKLANKHKFSSLKGFINGVLRNISRNKNDIDIENVSVLPEWLMEHFISNYGKENTDIMIEDFQKARPVTLRARRPLKNLNYLTEVEDEENIFVVKSGISPMEIEGYLDGDFVIQDISSTKVCEIAQIKENDLVVDVCASPGGKSIQASDMGARVISRDLTEDKIAIINENIDRCRAKNITTQVHDATYLDEELIDKADVVIADVPCSGLGVIGRKADIRFKVKKENLTNLQEIQQNIIAVVHKYVKKGGILMYSTCTINPKENEEQAKWIVDNFPFELLYEKQYLPGIDNTDGFYIAKLRRL